jgi:hypothetical protein
MCIVHENASFMQFMYILLGALLAVLGGFLDHKYERHLDRKDEEENLLHRCMELLLRYNAADSMLTSGSQKYDPETKLKVQIASRADRYRFLDELGLLAIKLRSKKHRVLALRLTKFALDESFRTEEELYSLTREVQMLLNKPLMERFEAKP